MREGLVENTFTLYIKDNCRACVGMVEKAARFAQDYGMTYKIYNNNSNKVPGLPCVNYCEYWIVGNRGFDGLPKLVKLKRGKIDA